MKTTLRVLLTCICACISIKSFAQYSWELEKDEEGILVYTKVEKDSDFKSFKAVIVLDASIPEIIRVLKNVDSYTTWYGYTKTSVLLNQTLDNQYNYVETQFPWPYDNRDMIYKMSINLSNPQKIIISLKGIPDYIPKKEGIVRMEKAEGYIILRPQADSTELTYVFHSEPGDNIPVWLANSSISELPYKTLIGLREILKEENKS